METTARVAPVPPREIDVIHSKDTGDSVVVPVGMVLVMMVLVVDDCSLDGWWWAGEYRVFDRGCEGGGSAVGEKDAAVPTTVMLMMVVMTVLTIVSATPCCHKRLGS